jgi:Protein of unknown function (DUF3226)
MEAPNPNRLVVEDTDLQGVVIGIMMHHIQWGGSKDEWPVYVQGKTGKSNVFKHREFAVEMKSSGTRRVGIVVDADSDLDATWNQVADFCRRLGGNPPTVCPKEGLITELRGQRFGAWIMPNNQMQGMVEHFCHDLVPGHAEALWKFALKCAKKARACYNAPFPEHYLPKAQIHTWLAWQETPGERMGAAITANVLGHDSDAAMAFVRWFVELFELKEIVKT